MKRNTRIIAVVAGVLAAGAAAGTGVAIAGGAGDDNEAPITGPALDQASQAALEFTGGGRVTETEVGDEESFFEVEVTLDDGSQVDVQLDEAFNVVGSKTERGGDDDENDGD